MSDITWGDIARWESVSIDHCADCGKEYPEWACEGCEYRLVCDDCRTKNGGCTSCETDEALTEN